MKKNKLWKILNTLQKTPKNNQKSERKKYLEFCSDDEIHAICGACKNLLCNNIKLTEKKKTTAKFQIFFSFAFLVIFWGFL